MRGPRSPARFRAGPTPLRPRLLFAAAAAFLEQHAAVFGGALANGRPELTPVWVRESRSGSFTAPASYLPLIPLALIVLRRRRSPILTTT
ncbi:MAG: hypothetical protein KF678_08520 [Phycisphaeraceae bacterium]|nr:hypothetical protein [Phycisphaeraceae bacterium]